MQGLGLGAFAEGAEGRWVEQSTRCSFTASRHWILVDLRLKSQATCLDLHLERAKHLQTRLRAENNCQNERADRGTYMQAVHLRILNNDRICMDMCVCVCVLFCILHTNRVQFVANQASHYSHPLLILVELLRCCIQKFRNIQLERQVAVEIAVSRSTSAMINNDKTDGDDDHDDESLCPKP